MFEAAQIISGLPKNRLASIKKNGVRINTETAKQLKPLLVNDSYSKSTQASDDSDSHDNRSSIIEKEFTGLERNTSGRPVIDISNLHLDDHNGPIKKTHIKIFNNSQKPVLSTTSPNLIVNDTNESTINNDYSAP